MKYTIIYDCEVDGITATLSETAYSITEAEEIKDALIYDDYCSNIQIIWPEGDY